MVLIETSQKSEINSANKHRTTVQIIYVDQANQAYLFQAVMFRIQSALHFVYILSSIISIVSAWPWPGTGKLNCGEYTPIFWKRFEDLAGKAEFPFMAEISATNRSIPLTVTCSGALISPTQILTSYKCARDAGGVDYILRVGSVELGSGKDVRVRPPVLRRISELGSESTSGCGNNTVIKHGLALIELREPLSFQKREPNINQVCVNYEPTHPAYSINEQFHAAYWPLNENDTSHLRAIKLISAKCDSSTKLGRICTEAADSKIHAELREGTPLVKLNAKTWTLLGIHSKDYDIWDQNCEAASAQSSVATFIPIHAPQFKFWLQDNIYGRISSTS